MKQNGTATVRDWVGRGAGRVHLAGICGVGMAGLANLLKARGFTVNGCDLHPGRMARWLSDRGIAVSEGHDAGHSEGGVDWVVRSAAVPPDSPEPARARALGLPVFTRGEVLPELLRGTRSVAVAGTHGKTSTSFFLAQVLAGAGRRPSWCIGGEIAAGGRGSAALGPSEQGDGGILVVEADESDGTLALYAPDTAVVTNIELDHLEYFGGEEELVDCFRRFVEAAGRNVVFCLDDPRAAGLCGGRANAASYGFSPAAHTRAADWREEAGGQSYRLEQGGQDLGRITLPFPGRQYALNSLAVAAVALDLGLTAEEVRRGLGRLRLPARRFEKVVERDGVLVISDYAHHPTEIATVIRMVPTGRRRLAIFQPHRYSRTLGLGPDFPAAFAGLAELILTPVYAASEEPVRGGSVWDLYRHFRKPGAGVVFKVSAAGSLEAAWRSLRHKLRAGDTLLLIGAGDIEQVAEWAKKECGRAPAWELASGASCPLVPVGAGQANRAEGGGQGNSQPPAEAMSLPEIPELKRDEPLAARTTLRVGGSADWWAEPESAERLAALAMWAGERSLPFRVLGGGSNVLVSDLGLRGLTVRLAGREFRAVRKGQGVAGGLEVVVGGAMSLAALLDWLEERGLAGLEFLEGIPGTVGGAARMNAGAWGGEIGRHILWIRCLNPDGALGIVPASELGPGYRVCRGLEGRVVIEAGLVLERGDPGAIRARRLEIAAKREWMKGLRSAGSVFKNPPGDYAGRLIEQAGLKGMSVGGATVSAAHANVIVTADGATASDVRALMEIVRAEVAERFGVMLEPEIVILE